MRVTEENLSPEERGIYLQASRAVREGNYNLAVSLVTSLLTKHPKFFDGRKVLVEATKWKFRDEPLPSAPLEIDKQRALGEPTRNWKFVSVLLLAFAAAAISNTGVFTLDLFLSGVSILILVVYFLAKSLLKKKDSGQPIRNQQHDRIVEAAQGVCQICGSHSPALFVVNKFPLVEDPDPSGPDERYVCVCNDCREAVEWLDTTPSPYAIQGNP